MQEKRRLFFMQGVQYPVKFRAGDAVIVRMTPEGLAAGRDAHYPLCDYHGRHVTVIAQTGKRDDEIVRESYPDTEGLVDVILPFPYNPGGKGTRPTSRMSVLWSVLEHAPANKA